MMRGLPHIYILRVLYISTYLRRGWKFEVSFWNQKEQGRFKLFVLYLNRTRSCHFKSPTSVLASFRAFKLQKVRHVYSCNVNWYIHNVAVHLWLNRKNCIKGGFPVRFWMHKGVKLPSVPLLLFPMPGGSANLKMTARNQLWLTKLKSALIKPITTSKIFNIKQNAKINDLLCIISFYRNNCNCSNAESIFNRLLA